MVVGCRIRARFGGRLVDGFVLDRVEASDHDGTLAYLDKVISSEPVLTDEVARLARAVADRYAGTLADVLRLAVPPRHARAESAGRGATPDEAVQRAAPHAGEEDGWQRYEGGTGFVSALHQRRRWGTGASGADRSSRARTGRHGSPRRSARPSTVDGARSRSYRTLVTSTALRRRCVRKLARTSSSRCTRRSVRPSATGGSCGREPRATSGRDRHPRGGVRPDPATLVWWRSGMTGTTCTRSPRAVSACPAGPAHQGSAWRRRGFGGGHGSQCRGPAARGDAVGAEPGRAA